MAKLDETVLVGHAQYLAAVFGRQIADGASPILSAGKPVEERKALGQSCRIGLATGRTNDERTQLGKLRFFGQRCGMRHRVLISKKV